MVRIEPKIMNFIFINEFVKNIILFINEIRVWENIYQIGDKQNSRPMSYLNNESDAN